MKFSENMPKPKSNIPSNKKTDLDSSSFQFGAAFGGDVIGCLSEAGEEFLVAQRKFEGEVDKALFVFTKSSLAFAFGAWIIRVKSLDPVAVGYCDEIFRMKVLPIHEDGSSPSIFEFSKLDHYEPIENIRMQRSKSLELRELLVSTYISFINWLSQITHNYIKSIKDPDQWKREGRIVSYEIFIKLLNCLDERSQLVAKLLYFGGTRTLEEVLSLEITDVNFKKALINYRSQLVQYPQHVFADIKNLIKNRTSGRVFIGRQDAPLHPSTIFRNLKEAGSRVGLGDSFSPKMLITNI